VDKKPLKFSSRAYFTLVPVIVTDKNGNHISGLTRDEFQVFEDGKEQIIASVGEIKISIAPVQRLPASQNEFSNAIAPDGGSRRINLNWTQHFAVCN
jgi:hypothetical protein